MSLNFDFSQLDKLPEGTAAKKGPKFQPKFLAKPRAGPSATQPASPKPQPAIKPVSQPTTAAEKKQATTAVAAAAPSIAEPAAAPVQLGVPSKRQIEQPTQVAPTTAPTRAPKRPRKQAQPLPAAAEFPGGLSIEPANRRNNAATGTEEHEKLRPAKPLGARAQAREDAALVPRKRGRPRKNTTAASTPTAPPADGGGSAPAIAPVDQQTGGRSASKSARKNMSTATTQPNRYANATEEEKRRAGFRRPSRNRRDYDKGLEMDDEFLYRDEHKRSKQKKKGRQVADIEENYEDEAEVYRDKYTGRYETEENGEIRADGAGPSKPYTRKPQQPSGTAEDGAEDGGSAGAGPSSKQGRKQSARKTPRKGEPLSTYKTKIKKIGDEKSKRKVAILADEALDADNWSLKKIVSWAGSRERKLKAEARKEKIKKQKDIAAKLAAGGDITAVLGDGAGTSADAQQQHPNRGAAGGNNQLALAGAAGAGPSTAPRGPQLPRNANLAPQVQVVDGRIVVNRQSLTVQAQEREQYTRVVNEDYNRLNSMTYMNRISNERWTTEDTELFYKALSQFGTDFTLISHLFPGRERRHLKNKYTRENKLHPDRIDEAMNQSSNGAINSYNDMIVMLKESGMAVGAGAAAAAGVGSPSAPSAAAAVLNRIRSPTSDGVNRTRGGRNTTTNTTTTNGAAPLAITEAGEPPSQEEEEEEEQEIIPMRSSRGRQIRPTIK